MWSFTYRAWSSSSFTKRACCPSDTHILGMRELPRVETEAILSGEADHLAKGIIDGHGQVVEVTEEHGGHVVFKGQTKPKFAACPKVAGGLSLALIANQRRSP